MEGFFVLGEVGGEKRMWEMDVMDVMDRMWEWT
jgi:hypothetical protein